ncbi:RNA polymerase sigma factor [Ulvibacter antarcticus]|uniref:RNA polymerase sigma factor (Sigma-70 family) n=1 Tax=Ulvibacter antarcticus TaxID=442714 RepID=A0A3L9YCN8_9FLAO|nr:sigma-70 family RNA polymerase sigma factor [Ulvibacter antarcticus]RMA58503.1 RNA polymerase sigma factor (sigma-70 family) [Ulvibacter antarcticus]
MMNGPERDRNKALGIVYRTHKQMVCSYIMKNSGSPEEAKDVYQEAMIAMYENVGQGKFKGDSAIGTYLYSIARFKWLNQIKKNSVRSSHHEKLETPEFQESPMTVIIEKEHKNAVLEVLTELGDSCKRLLVDTMYNNASMKEIVLKGEFSSEQIARNKKYKCLQKLKELIQNKPGLLQKLKGNE